MIKRYISSMGVATAITFALFFLMQTLVDSGDTRLSEDEDFPPINMVQVPRVNEPETKDRTLPPEPEDIEEEPEIEFEPRDRFKNPKGPKGPFKEKKLVMDEGPDRGMNGPIDGEYLPIVRVQPQYPRIATSKGIEGHVLVEFTVTHLGNVENPTIIEADPPGYFERAAIKAVLKFKYKPKVLNGVPMAVTGVRNLISFKLDE